MEMVTQMVMALVMEMLEMAMEMVMVVICTDVAPWGVWIDTYYSRTP